jgi:cell division protein FtsL
MNGTGTAAQGWRNVAVVREHDHRGTRWIFCLVGGIVIAAIPFVFYLVRQIDYVHVRYQTEDLRAQYDRLLEAERRLQMERTSLESLPRVESRATREMGLVRPLPDRVVVMREIRAGGAPVRAPVGVPPVAR